MLSAQTACRILCCFGLTGLTSCAVVPTDESDAGEEVATAASELVSGNYAYTSNPSPASPGWYSAGTLTFTVPTNPATRSTQTLSYYLQFANTSSATRRFRCQVVYKGTTNTWSMSCCYNSTCGASVSVLPGESVYSLISARDCDANGTCGWAGWIYNLTRPGNYASYDSGTNTFKSTYAMPFVENVTNLTACTQLPNQNSITGNTVLWVGNTAQDTGSWWVNIPSADPVCNRSINTNNAQTTINQSH